MQLPTSTVVLSILFLSFVLSGCGWRTIDLTKTDDTDSGTDTVGTDNADSENMYNTDFFTDSESAPDEGSDMVSDSETIGTDDSETESDTCPPCGSVSAGDMDITEDIYLDVYLRAFSELKRKLDDSGAKTQSLLVQAAADWKVDDTDLSVTELADALATAIRSDIDTNAQDGVTVAESAEPTCRILEEKSLETEIWCEVDKGCDCAAASDEVIDDFICVGVCQGHCTGECYCEVDGVSDLYDATLCDDSALCDSKCRGVCDGGCLGEIIPPRCDTSCGSARECQQLAQQCSSVHLSCTLSSLTLTYLSVDDVMNETSTLAFILRMEQLRALLESLRREMALLRTLFDDDYADSVGFDCPGQDLAYELGQSYINNIAKGSFDGPECKAPCIDSAIAESVALKNSFYSDAMPYIEAQMTVLGTVHLY